MKKNFLFTMSLALAMAMPLAAQDDLVIYGDETTGIVWQNFAGPTNVQEVANPSPDAVNATGKCISMLRPKETGDTDEIGWPWEGALSESFDVPNIAEYNSLTMLVKKPYPGKVCVELQNLTGGNSSMIWGHYTAVDGSWQKLTFPIINISSLGETGLTKILVEIHREVENDNDNFEDCIMYADEITLHKAMPAFGFNGEDLNAGGWLPFPGDELSKKALIVDNPDKAGVNETVSCLKIVREKNDEVFAGAINRNLKVHDLSPYKYFTMLVKKDIAGPVALELQSPGETQKQVLSADYTEVGKWQELRFDIPENVLAGEPLQIIILQAHAVDTKEDETFTEPIDIYVDELYLSDGTTSTGNVVVSDVVSARIVKSELYSVNGTRVAVWDGASYIPSDVNSGVYILRQTDELGKVHSKKIFK